MLHFATVLNHAALLECEFQQHTMPIGLDSAPYRVPVINQLLLAVTEGKVFVQSDLTQTYQQLKVSDSVASTQSTALLSIEKLSMPSASSSECQ